MNAGNSFVLTSYKELVYIKLCLKFIVPLTKIIIIITIDPRLSEPPYPQEIIKVFGSVKNSDN